MRHLVLGAWAAGLLVLAATPALARDADPSPRDVQAAVDAYLATTAADATLVGGPGTAGYEGGFWIRGGSYVLRVNLTLQARYEWFDYDEEEEGHLAEFRLPGTPPAPGGPAGEDIVRIPWPGGDLSGFSMPRATLKLSGEADCRVRYYAELEFGDPGWGLWTPVHTLLQAHPWPFLNQGYAYDVFREGWVEYGISDLIAFRAGKIKTPNTRQLMVAPELQQFVDVSMASSLTGALQPGYTDRNRDYGLLIHGLFGCDNEWQYMVAVTNGDGGDTTRNVLNPLTSDDLAYSARLNWAFLRPVGYTEGAIRQRSCTWYGEAGIWGHYYADRVDGGHSGLVPHLALYDRLALGLDLALGYGGFTFTGAFTYVDLTGSDLFFDETWMLWLAQAGYHLPSTAWEVALRWSAYARTLEAPGGDLEPGTNEFAVAVNYYLNGHGNKLQLDATFVRAEGDGPQGGGWYDLYAGVPLGFNSDGNHVLVRLQWQLAL